MEEEKNIYCPIKQHGLFAFCDKDSCAWWCELTKQCAVKQIADNLDAVADMSSGQRTLFVREV